MAGYKTSAAVFSAAVLAACAPPNYYGDLDNERHVERIVCKNVAPINSNIRRKTCRVSGRKLSFQERKDILRQGYRGPEWGMRPTQGAARLPAEGSCGGARGD